VSVPPRRSGIRPARRQPGPASGRPSRRPRPLRPPPGPPQAETERVRGDTEKAIGELRADLRARAEQQADAYRDELAQLRAASPAGGTGNGSAPARTTRRAARTRAT